MFERPDSGERVVLVHLDIGAIAEPEELEELRLRPVNTDTDTGSVSSDE